MPEFTGLESTEYIKRRKTSEKRDGEDKENENGNGVFEVPPTRSLPTSKDNFMATEEEEMGETTPQSVQSARSGRWTDNEQLIFLQGLRKYGKGQWKLISREITTRSVTQIKSHAQKFLKKIAAGENIFKMLDSPEAEGNLTMPSYDFFNVGTGSAATKGVDFKQEMLAKTYVNSGKPTRVKNPVVKNAVVINMRLLNEPEFEDMFATWKDHSLPLGAWTTGMHSLLKEKFPLLLKKYNYFDTDRRNALCQFMDKKKKSNKRKAGDGKAKTKNAQVLPPLAQLFKDNPLLAPNNTMLPPDMSALFSSNFNPAAANIVIINDSNLSAYTHTHTRIHNINNNINIINNNNTSAPIIMRLSYEPEFEDLFATWKDHSLPLGAWTTGMHSLLKEKFPLLLKKYNYFDTDRRKAFCQFLMDKKKSNRKAEVGASKGVGFKHDLLAETTKITSSTGMSAAPSHVVWSCVPQHDEYKQSDSTSNIDAYLRWENLQAPRTE